MRTTTAALVLALMLSLTALCVLNLSSRREPAALLIVGAILTGIAGLVRRHMKRSRASEEIL
ncbi:MAG: hypothetical protein H7Y30_04405 [Pyrinomonadaceae bacterium]|nr:hypothetical protein [Pyrinomonadaceae bacterium]